MVVQYYVMKSNNFLMLIIDFNNIHEFNILKYILSILSKIVAIVSDWHTLPCLCPPMKKHNLMWICSYPYYQPNLHHNRHTFVCFHKQCHNPQYWDIGFVKYSFQNAIDTYCFHQFLSYDKHPFQNASCPLCSCWNLGHGLCFF